MAFVGPIHHKSNFTNQVPKHMSLAFCTINFDELNRKSRYCMAFVCRCAVNAWCLYVRENMKATSNYNIFWITGHFEQTTLTTGGFLSQRPVTWSFDAFFDWSLIKWFSKQSRRQWYKTPLHSSWHHGNKLFPSLVPHRGISCRIRDSTHKGSEMLSFDFTLMLARTRMEQTVQ